MVGMIYYSFLLLLLATRLPESDRRTGSVCSRNRMWTATIAIRESVHCQARSPWDHQDHLLSSHQGTTPRRRRFKPKT